MYSVVVFIVLASMDNVAIGIVPPLYGNIGTAFGVPPVFWINGALMAAQGYWTKRGSASKS